MLNSSGSELAVGGPTTILLCQLLKKRPEILKDSHTHLKSYVERNTSFVMMKAIALNIFAGSVSSGFGIVESCNLASACTNYSSEMTSYTYFYSIVCFGMHGSDQDPAEYEPEFF